MFLLFLLLLLSSQCNSIYKRNYSGHTNTNCGCFLHFWISNIMFNFIMWKKLGFEDGKKQSWEEEKRIKYTGDCFGCMLIWISRCHHRCDCIGWSIDFIDSCCCCCCLSIKLVARMVSSNWILSRNTISTTPILISMYLIFITFDTIRTRFIYKMHTQYSIPLTYNQFLSFLFCETHTRMNEKKKKKKSYTRKHTVTFFSLSF